MSLSKLAFGLVGLVGSVAGYTLEKDYSGSAFFSGMTFFTAADPTHGYVQYVGQSEAQSEGLISTNGGSVKMGVAANGTAASPGRQSVRVSSTQSYSTGLFVADVGHMPVGCGTWPAFWLVGPNWPNDGEIDIIEGVNSQTTNKMTLHTGPGCTISNSGTGSVQSTDCDVTGGSNTGCGVQAKSSQSFGAALNSGGGAVYATEVTASTISIWFWPHGSAPSDVLGASPNPASWGTPAAEFTGCDISSHFQQMSLVFDTTFCGDWAGDSWSTDTTCASKSSSCQAYVENPPSGAFNEAYWTVNSLKVYGGSGSSSSPSGSGSGSGSGVSSSEAAHQASPSAQSGGSGTGSGGQAPSSSPAPTAAPAAPTAPSPGQPLEESWFQPHVTQGAQGRPWKRHLARHIRGEKI